MAAQQSYIVKAPAIKVSIGPDGGNKIARILRKGEALPEIDKTRLEHLLKAGLIEKAPAPAKSTTPTATDKAAAEKAAAEKAAAEKAAADAAAK